MCSVSIKYDKKYIVSGINILKGGGGVVQYRAFNIIILHYYLKIFNNLQDYAFYCHQLMYNISNATTLN